MKRDEISKIIYEETGLSLQQFPGEFAEIMAVCERVAAAEREESAKVVEGFGFSVLLDAVAAAIRGRGKK